ncbi:hypothetical protein [Streptomyces laurentii]|uniref:hypothetical protein n=1 Tax=Streptomyces laurentii TaxID=39478 RepID=UPI0036AFA795
MPEPGLQGRHPAPSAQGEVRGGAATEFRIVLQGPYGRLPAHQELVEEVAVRQGRPGRREVRVAGERRPQRAQFQDRPVRAVSSMRSAVTAGTTIPLLLPPAGPTVTPRRARTIHRPSMPGTGPGKHPQW